MALPRGTDINPVGQDASGGDTLGSSTSSLISFYGVTAVAQRSGASQAAVSNSAFVILSASKMSAGAWGFASSTMVDALISDVIELQNRLSANIVLTNELRAALVALGAIAGA